MYNRQLTYGDFLRSPEKIATNTLATRLKQLEASNIIERIPHPARKNQAIYRLTPMGIDLVPAMIEISLWADKYFSIDPARKAMLVEVRKDKAKFLDTVMQKLHQQE